MGGGGIVIGKEGVTTSHQQFSESSIAGKVKKILCKKLKTEGRYGGAGGWM